MQALGSAYMRPKDAVKDECGPSRGPGLPVLERQRGRDGERGEHCHEREGPVVAAPPVEHHGACECAQIARDLVDRVDQPRLRPPAVTGLTGVIPLRIP